MRYLYLFLILILTSITEAAPLVVGYDRFHSDSPSVEGGAILYSELGCANCHGGSNIEIPRKGPALHNLSNRINYDWLIEFLRNPQSSHPGTGMPGVTHGLSEEDIKSIAAFIGKIGTPKKLKAGRHANAERGSSLYHEKGCVACHAPTPDYRGPHGKSVQPNKLAVPLPDLGAKYSLTSLDFFLSNVSQFRTDGRMPHIDLTNEESIDLAAHLIDFQASDPREAPNISPWPKTNAAEIKRGQTLVTNLNCTSCHSIPKIEAPALRPIENVKGSCLSERPIPGVPHYQLTKEHKSSLVTYLSHQAGENDSKGDLTLSALNCYACHARDGKGGPLETTNHFFIGNESLGDSGRLPPPLTGIGHKLQPKWLEQVFAGNKETRVRPYLKTQMPKYPTHAAKLAEWLGKTDQKLDSPPLSVNPDHIDDGRKLLGINGGVNCITCHNWDDKKSLGIPGPDISALDKRLRPEWFREYLLNPAEYRPGTLMPPLWPEGHSAIPTILDGDTEKQIAAIWTFIRDGEGIPEGFPDHSSNQFELIPTDRPIIQRTFLEKAGTKAILVGFPGDIHLAYDGLHGKPSLIWRGRFFDAYNTWFTRSAPIEKPLSDEVYEFAPSGESSRFKGYTIDPSGNPTFVVVKSGQKIEESFKVKDGHLIRTLQWEGGEPPSLTHPTGVKKEVVSSSNSITVTYSWK
ncbi:MAG: c-type cytochrome [Verrucomicrobiales bacterium]|nr:c-type cytochrome [Verrucomicrobiales bacterium]